MAQDDVTLNINAKVDNAVSAIKSLETKATASLGVMTGAFDSLKTIAGVALAAFAGTKVVGFFGDAIDAAAEADREISKLKTSLISVGDYTPEILESFDEFAGSLEETSRFSGEAAVSQISLAKQLGLTNEKSKQLVQAAADLASVTGDSLESAFSELSKSLLGSAGALGKTIPEVKGLTEEQLKAGAAIDLVSKRLAGAALRSIQDFSGALGQAENASGDITKAIGKVITQNPVVVEAIQASTKGFRSLEAIVADNKDQMQNFVSEVIKLAASALPGVVTSIGFVIKAFEGIALGATSLVAGVASLAESFLSFEDVADIVSFVAQEVTQMFANIVAAGGTFLEFVSEIPGVSSEFKDFAKTSSSSLAALQLQLENFSIDTKVFDEARASITSVKEDALEMGANLQSVFVQAESGVNTFGEQVQKVAEAIQAADGVAADSARKLADEQIVAGQAAVKSAVEVARIQSEKMKEQQKEKEAAEKELEKNRDKARDFIERIYSSELNNIQSVDAARGKDNALLATYYQQKLVSEQEYADAVVIINQTANDKIFELRKKENEKIGQLISDFATGGLKSLAQGGLSTFVDAFFPGFGAAAGQLFGVLSQGADEFAKTLDNMFSTDFLDNIANNLVSLVEKLPGIVLKIVNYLADNASEIIQGLITGMLSAVPELVSGLLKAFIKIFLDPRFAIEIAKGVILGVALGLKDIIGDISEAFKKGVSDISGGLSDGVFAGFSTGIEKAFEPIGSFLQDAFGPSLKAIGDSFKSLFNAVLGDTFSKAAELFKNLFSQISLNFSGLTDGITRAAGVFKSIGSDLANIVSNLGKNVAEAFQTAFKQITDFLVNAIKTYLEGFAAIFTGLKNFGDNLKNIFSDLKSSIGSAFSVGNLSSLFSGIFENSFSKSAGNIMREFKDIFSTGFSGALKSIASEFEKLFELLIKPYKDLFEGITGGGSGGIKGALKKIGFASGGVVPAGYPNDSFPIPFAQSGEAILDPNLTRRIAGMVARDESGLKSSPSNDIQTTLLVRILDKLSEPINVATTAQVQDKAFAEIFLSLKRTNQLGFQ